MEWITCTRPNHDAVARVFCFSHAGGTGHDFEKWSTHSSMIDCEVGAFFFFFRTHSVPTAVSGPLPIGPLSAI
jgi:hypothetical protein